MAIIETEIWKPNPDRPGTLIFDSSREAQDVFSDLKKHLTSIGRMPDEYFSLWMDWENGKLFPKDATLSCEVNFGGSEGIYLDISISYKKDVYEYSRDTGELGWHNRSVIERFATGKTLGETNDDLDRMNLIASAVTSGFYGYENGVHARYVAVKQDDHENTAKTIYGDVQPGDWVISAANNDYKYLIGTVTGITKLGTPEHAVETDNDTDNIHVDFTAFAYPQERISEIEDHFSDLYGERKSFDDIALDDVIMAPNMLISITHLGQNEIAFIGNLLHNCESFCSSFPGGGEPQNEKHAVLMERLEKNLTDHHASLMGFGKRELIEMAEKIAAVSDAYSYLTMYNRFDDSELDFFLRFQDPLTVVADNWYERRSELDEMEFTMGYINDRRGEYLNDYPLIADVDTPADSGKHNPPDSIKQTAEKPKTLQEKLQAANEKAKAQEVQNKNNKSHKREERE
jgi:hypothetical protein